MKKITRRQTLGIAAGAATALGVTAAVIRSSATSAPEPGASAKGPAPTGSVPALPDVSALDEVYQGSRIQIVPAAGGGHHDGHHLPSLPTIRIDGKELHLMPNADGTWISVVNHYETFPDPVSAARAAVRDLKGAALVPFDPKAGRA
ncbi:tyrosinase family oxidase copper chaperone [Streptomyces sp. WAC06614]|uniref:apotyrosinase chaperone MelC1 n=1 Tax=Streptomyces sp. WAC06614 TaxID=2487416 RepID=UPI000F78DFD5|nr:tyrosinase family oxidase copper chaperone [Streptomyces sp. WAC06614]RSS78272.1 tyrosinase [Streptomyces sp. WAC06614]